MAADNFLNHCNLIQSLSVMFMTNLSHHCSSKTPLKKNFTTITFNSLIYSISMYSKELEGENETSTFAATSAVLFSQDDGLSDHLRLASL